MEHNIFYPASYEGSKDYAQWDVPTANATGFGAAADDYAERGIDLNEQLIRNKPATFFMRINGRAMTGDGIHPGDVVIVDRSLDARNGKVIIAVLDGEMLIRRFERIGSRSRLLASAPGEAPIEITPASTFEVWGVVTYVIHSL